MMMCVILHNISIKNKVLSDDELVEIEAEEDGSNQNIRIPDERIPLNIFRLFLRMQCARV